MKNNFRKKNIKKRKNHHYSEINVKNISQHNISTQKSFKKNNKNINKNDTIKLTINELNDLPYNMALKLDKRGYFIYYLSILKIKHILLFTFFLNHDNNLKIVKIDLFSFLFIFSFTTNALFFNDSSMHKIFNDQGNFNLEYQIPQILYSTIIVSGINALIQFLALTEKDIISLKSIKSKSIRKRKKIYIFLKVFIYFIISFLLLLFFSFYLCCFCFIYENTKIHLIKDTSISFGLNLIYPIFICLIWNFQKICIKKK